MVVVGGGGGKTHLTPVVGGICSCDPTQVQINSRDGHMPTCQKQELPEMRISTEKLPKLHWPVDLSGVGVNLCRRAWLTVGSTIHRQVVLNCVRKLVEYKLACEPNRKPHSP